MPSFANGVSAIMKNKCATCHSPGGQNSALPLTTYDQIYAARSGVLNQVYACRMPLAGSPPLTADERRLLIAWLACGAPNN